MTPKEVLQLAKEKNARMVDMKFLDFVGIWQHFSIPISELKEEIFEEGLGFDGSSIRGWQPIHASDMLVVPDPVTAVMDPFMEAPTLSLICNIVDPITTEDYSRDPRNIAKKAEADRNAANFVGNSKCTITSREVEKVGIHYDQSANQ